MTDEDELRSGAGLKRERKAEIEMTLGKLGASDFEFGYSRESAFVSFTFRGQAVRFSMPLPARKSRARDQERARDHWMADCAVNWELLQDLLVKKLTMVKVELTSFEEEFMARLVMPDGRTFAEHAWPLIKPAGS